MKKILYILRHAKAEFAEDYADDHARPLNERGRNDAIAMGERLRTLPHQPQQVVCSTARRTRETHAALGLDVPVAYSERLYLASTGELLAQVNALPDTANTALIVGHNPGVHELVGLLCYDAKNEDDTERLREKFPTCTLAVLSFDMPWHEIMPDSARLEALYSPAR